MDAAEREICEFLKSWPGQFISGREIARRSGGKWRFNEDKDWAVSVLARLVERGMVEADSTGHFRLIPKVKKEDKSKKWVSPQIKKILEESGKDFGNSIKLEDDIEL